MNIIRNLKAAPKKTLYITIFLLMVAFRLMLPLVAWQPAPAWHTVAEVTLVSLALFVGVLALVRFYTRRDTVYFFVGMGFFGAGLLSTYHFFSGDGLFIGTEPVSSLHAVDLNAVIFLAVFLAGSWLVWFRSQGRALLTRRLVMIDGVILLMHLAYFVWVGRQFGAETWLTAVAATLLLLALMGYWQKGYWRSDVFEHWLVISLIILYGSQALFLVFATQSNDLVFLAGLFWQAVSYLAVLVGLLISTVTVFRRVAVMVEEQARINEALQREVAERKRIEVAEQEQRQLAEALREVGIALSAVLDFNRLLDILLDQIARVLPFDTASVMVVQGKQVEMGVTRGYDQNIRPGVPERFPIDSIPSLQRMLETVEPLIVPDTASHELWVHAEESPHVRSWAGAPITMKGQVIAFIALNNRQPNFYQPADAARLSAFASQAAVAFDNVRLYEELRQRAEELSTLNAISQSISSTLNLQETLTIITESTVRLLRVEAASVVLLDTAVGDLTFAAASGEAAEYVRGQRLSKGQGVIGWVAEHGEPLLVADTTTDARHFSEFDQKSGFFARSILCVPLRTRGQTIGALEAINKELGAFNEEDLNLMTRLAAPAATAIENARLFAQARQEIAERARIEKALEAERALLARRVAERTADLSTANAELARAARLKDEFLASMSHELRTPLNAILGISEALQEEVYGDLNENQMNSLNSIEESGRHLLALINDILDLSKIEAGKLELELRPVPIESICEASLRIVKQNAHKKRLTIHSAFDSQVQTIQVDERRMKQVLVNLLSNAVKFTPEGGDIGVEVVGDEEGDAVHITVWDTGIGITEEDIDRLFQPFVQLDSRLSREFGGTGLGLSLVSRMTELHGGSVTVESDAGQGSRFTVSIPWLSAKSLGPSLEEVQRGDGARSLSAFRLALLVDDSPAATTQMKRYLNELEIDVVAQAHGRGAVKQVLTIQPDIIILDILLPDLSGWEILAQLQTEPRTRRIPVVIVSVIDERENALAAGAYDCLLKPVSRQQLHNTLQRLWKRQQRFQTRPLPSGPFGEAEPGDKKETSARARILLAEDNEANLKTFTHYLQAKGFEILVAQNGLEAVDQALQERPDLILMDIQMPQMNGLEAITKIRASDEMAEVPIIAVTALAMPGDAEKCLVAGANDYLSKPVSLKGLLTRIQAQLKT